MGLGGTGVALANDPDPASSGRPGAQPVPERVGSPIVPGRPDVACVDDGPGGVDDRFDGVRDDADDRRDDDPAGADDRFDDRNGVDDDRIDDCDAGVEADDRVDADDDADDGQDD
ncbi:ATPase [Saccharopolyspora griseoalba]|uniref:ATPase n=1 Tax=Saccharopolyspora griseoalba TaxID=1431848 RepID=A0ABW2LR34_9PSEU